SRSSSRATWLARDSSSAHDTPRCEPSRAARIRSTSSDRSVAICVSRRPYEITASSFAHGCRPRRGARYRRRVADREGDDRERLSAWVQQHIGGTVTRIDRLSRWRPAWDLDVALDGEVLPLHARGERELSFAIPYRIADELATHDLLESAGVPVPHAYGLCP